MIRRRRQQRLVVDNVRELFRRIQVDPRGSGRLVDNEAVAAVLASRTMHGQCLMHGLPLPCAGDVMERILLPRNDGEWAVGTLACDQHYATFLVPAGFVTAE